MQTAAALCLAFGSLCVGAEPELVFSSAASGLRGASHCNILLHDGVLVSSCDFAHGKTGFNTLQTEVDGLKAENTELRSEMTALRTELMSAINTISLTAGPAGAKGADGAAGANGAAGDTGATGQTGATGSNAPNLATEISRLSGAHECLQRYVRTHNGACFDHRGHKHTHR